jgi:hypothetical protein
VTNIKRAMSCLFDSAIRYRAGKSGASLPLEMGRQSNRKALAKQ